MKGIGALVIDDNESNGGAAADAPETGDGEKKKQTRGWLCYQHISCSQTFERMCTEASRLVSHSFEGKNLNSFSRRLNLIFRRIKDRKTQKERSSILDSSLV